MQRQKSYLEVPGSSWEKLGTPKWCVNHSQSTGTPASGQGSLAWCGRADSGSIAQGLGRRGDCELKLSSHYRVVPEMTNEVLANLNGLHREWKYSNSITVLALMKVLPEYSVQLCCPHTLTSVLAIWEEFRRKLQGSFLPLHHSLSCKEREKRKPVHRRGRLKVDIVPRQQEAVSQ